MWNFGICRGVLLVTLAPGAILVTALLRAADPEESAAPAAAPPARVHCVAPQTLRLRRYEDRSAQLLCGGRVLVRVSVPG